MLKLNYQFIISKVWGGMLVWIPVVNSIKFTLYILFCAVLFNIRRFKGLCITNFPVFAFYALCVYLCVCGLLSICRGIENLISQYSIILYLDIVAFEIIQFIYTIVPMFVAERSSFFPAYFYLIISTTFSK